MRINKRIMCLIAILLGLTMVAAACGGGDDDSSSSSSESSSESSSSSEEAISEAISGSVSVSGS